MSSLQSFSLENWDVIQVSGDDATSFLNNLLTVDVSKITLSNRLALGSDFLRLAAFCSSKGRVVASFWVSLHEFDTLGKSYFIWISKDIAYELYIELKKYIFRSKVKIEYFDNKFKLIGYFSTNKEEIISTSKNSGDISIFLPPVVDEGKEFYRLIKLVNSQNYETYKSLVGKNNLISQWNLLEIKSGIPRIVKKTSQIFIPQMINFESVHGIDFQKGCYPGQEIIARSQYRGTIKRRLKLAQFPTTDECKPSPGDLIYSNEDLNQPAGVVILSEVNIKNLMFELQIEIKLEYISSLLVINSNNIFSKAHLSVRDVPYSLLDI